MRTTLDIDDPVLAELKRLVSKEDKSLGTFVSELLTEALAARRAAKRASPVAFDWQTASMGARLDPSDKDGLWAALEAAGEERS